MPTATVADWIIHLGGAPVGTYGAVLAALSHHFQPDHYDYSKSRKAFALFLQDPTKLRGFRQELGARINDVKMEMALDFQARENIVFVAQGSVGYEQTTPAGVFPEEATAVPKPAQNLNAGPVAQTGWTPPGQAEVPLHNVQVSRGGQVVAEGAAGSSAIQAARSGVVQGTRASGDSVLHNRVGGSVDAPRQGMSRGASTAGARSRPGPGAAPEPPPAPAPTPAPPAPEPAMVLTDGREEIQITPTPAPAPAPRPREEPIPVDPTLVLSRPRACWENKVILDTLTGPARLWLHDTAGGMRELIVTPSREGFAASLLGGTHAEMVAVSDHIYRLQAKLLGYFGAPLPLETSEEDVSTALATGRTGVRAITQTPEPKSKAPPAEAPPEEVPVAEEPLPEAPPEEDSSPPEPSTEELEPEPSESEAEVDEPPSEG